MPSDADWSDRAHAILSRYAEPLRRAVTAQLVKPRAPIPADDLADKCLATLGNPPVLDRRIKELPDPARKLLAGIGLSRRPTWRVGHLVSLLAALGHADGVGPVFTLLDNGLLFPDLPDDAPAEVVQFDTWLGWAGTLYAPVFVPPAVAARARGEDLGLPVLAAEAGANGAARQADGLDWPLRLAVAWQMVAATPVRLTQANTLFKRDLGRMQTDEVLTAAPPDQLVAVPDPGVLALFWANAAGLLDEKDGELHAGPFPERWGSQLGPALADLWAGLTAVEGWDPLAGYAPSDDGLSTLPSAGLLAVLLVARVPAGGWADSRAIAEWLWEHHPAWGGALSPDAQKVRGLPWVEAFLLGVAYPLRLVEANSGGHVRLTDFGRHLLAGGPEPAAAPVFPQTLIVQPNAEILAYRQGLTPALVAKLTRFARWKGVGPACTLELTPESTYRGLETGMTLAGVVQTLAQHSTRPVPPAVQDLVRRWADKRERISVVGSATLVEFQSPADLDAAVSRGVVAVKLTDRIGMTDDGRDPDFKHLRLVGNRDYEAKPQRCLAVADDGLTLTVDPALSDLLLEAEIGKIADSVNGDPAGLRRYKLSPISLRRAAAAGWSVAELDAWFLARSGGGLSPAGRLFATAPGLSPPTAERLLVVKVGSEAAADGLMQWPATRGLIAERIGPAAVVVAEHDLPQLRDVLAEIGVVL